MDVRAVKIRVGPEWRVGALYSPSLTGRHPAVLSLHGFPGVQKNEDIATELCRRGIVVFAPYAAGSWGSGGTFSVPGLMTDARAAHRLLSRYRHVDPRRIGVLGLSLGGWTALRLAAERTHAAVVALAPAVPWPAMRPDEDYLRRNAKVLKISDCGRVWRDYALAGERHPPRAYLGLIAPTPLLLVHGLRDAAVPPESTRALWALAAEPRELVELADEEHELQNGRERVVRLVADWLASRLGLGQRPAEAFSQIGL